MLQHALLSDSCLKEFDALLLFKTSVDNGTKESDVSWLDDVFTGVFLDDISCADFDVTYYVSGFVGRTISCCRNCSFRKELLIAVDNSSSIHIHFQMNTNSCLKI